MSCERTRRRGRRALLCQGGVEARMIVPRDLFAVLGAMPIRSYPR